MTGQGIFSSCGTFSARNRSSPTFASPIALSIPARVSTIRVGSLPARSSRVMDLVTNAPSLERSMKSAYSNAYPHVPEQVRVGLDRFRPLRLTERSGTSSFYANGNERQVTTNPRRRQATIDAASRAESLLRVFADFQFARACVRI